MKRFALFGVVGLAGLPALPSAEAGTWKDGPAAAYVFGGDVESDGFGFGYQATYEHNRNLSVEFSGLWHDDESDAIAAALPTVVAAPPIDLEVIALALTGRVSVQPTPSLLAYAGGGVGYYIIKANNQDVRQSLSGTGYGHASVDGDKEFGGHFSLGCELVLTRHWEIFAEYRQAFVDSGYTVRYAPDRDSPVDDRRDDFSYDHSLIRIGLNYRF